MPALDNLEKFLHDPVLAAPMLYMSLHFTMMAQGRQPLVEWATGT